MKRNIYRVETGLRSFTYPVVKIILFVLLITAVLLFACLVDLWVESKILIFLLDLLAVAVLLACLFGIGIAGAEIDATIENREKDHADPSKKSKDGEVFSVEKLFSLIEKNDIMDIEVVHEGVLIHLGASSDMNNASSEFFDKRYYIGETEYMSFSEFQNAMASYMKDETVFVVSVDGVKPKYIREQ